MEIMKAITARKMTVDAIEAKRARMLDIINTRILTNISLGEFECDFIIDSPAIQDGLFDYFTSLGYEVYFSPIPNSDSRIMNISWEDAIQ